MIAVGVVQRASASGAQRPDQLTAADGAGAEPRRLLGRAHHQRRRGRRRSVGSPPQLGGQLQPEHGAERAVVAAAVGDRVDVRARGDERAVPAARERPQVAVAVDSRFEPVLGRPAGDQPHRLRLGGRVGGAVGAARRARARSPTAPGGARSIRSPSGISPWNRAAPAGRSRAVGWVVQASAYSASGLPSIASTSG